MRCMLLVLALMLTLHRVLIVGKGILNFATGAVTHSFYYRLLMQYLLRLPRTIYIPS